FPFANFTLLHKAGLLALTVPTHLGGNAAGLAEAARLVGTIAAGEPSTALVLAMQFTHHALIARSSHFPRHLAERLGREAASAVALINALRVEPKLGTPARGGLPATTATRTAQGWRLSGHKIYATGAPILVWYLVWAKTDEEEPRVGHFLVRAGLPGIRIVESWDHLGMRATGSHDVVLDGVEIPLDHAVDIRAPADWALEPEAWAWNTLLIGAVYDGIARAAQVWLHGFVEYRRPSALGVPLSSLSRVQSVVGEIEGHLAVNARLLASACADVDRGRPPAVAELGLLKRAITGNAVSAVEAALTLTGNHGLSRRNPLERHLRDVLCSRIHTPQDDSVLLTAGRQALALA
ncbi:MAG: acyl-CoA dehydrogenase family protein, partial [Geminicoccaceae bacterium]